VGKNIAIWHCPADPRTGLYQGSQPSMIGKTVPAARSISMDSSCGSYCTAFPGGHCAGSCGSKKTVGSWVDGSRYGNSSGQFETYGKTTDFKHAGSSQIFMICDESPWTINDACLGTDANVGNPGIVDYPASFHAGGCGF